MLARQFPSWVWSSIWLHRSRGNSVFWQGSFLAAFRPNIGSLHRSRVKALGWQSCFLALAAPFSRPRLYLASTLRAAVVLFFGARLPFACQSTALTGLTCCHQARRHRPFGQPVLRQCLAHRAKAAKVFARLHENAARHTNKEATPWLHGLNHRRISRVSFAFKAAAG